MINKSKQNERSALIAKDIDADTINKQFIEAPMNAARQPAITTGLDLLAFMSLLPDAFIASEERELKRLSRTSETKNDARIERLQISIERAQEIRSNAAQGKARIDRALVALSENGNIFHGFVSDVDLKPRKGLTVRISAKGNERVEASRSATTDADGYFSIPLDNGKKDTRKTAAPESDATLSDRMAELLSNVNANNDTTADKKSSADKANTAASDQKEALAQVEILDDNKNVLYQDPSPLVINTGTAYREYVIVGNEPRKSHEPNQPSPTKPTGPIVGKSDYASSKPAANTSATTSKPAPPIKKTTDTKTKK